MVARILREARKIWRIFAARPRLVIGVTCGLIAAPLVPHELSRVTGAIIAWDVGVIVYLVTSVALFITERIDRIAADAAAQEEGEWVVFWLTVAGVAFSFAAIVEEFAGISDHPAADKRWHVVLVAITLLVSWLMTHASFAFRYAHEYYQTDSDSPGINGGLEFPGETRPDYLDFLYFALVIGMTFQVSDVEISSRPLRRLAMVHGLLSFLFNTIIVALTVNLAAGML